MYTYKLILSDGGLVNQVKKFNAETPIPFWIIPFDPANTDYQEYLKWISEGNQPLPADGE
jgi:hypothetical protein